MERTLKEKIPKNYEQDAIRLEGFIKSYVPPGWKEPIGSAMTGFMFLAEDIERMETDYNEGILKERMDAKYNNPNVAKAIMNYFDKR
ncbi:MAG: hypothetical protein Q8L47_01085 [bacterium]|nr:hypothetical protein [bacterium]